MLTVDISEGIQEDMEGLRQCRRPFLFKGQYRIYDRFIGKGGLNKRSGEVSYSEEGEGRNGTLASEGCGRQITAETFRGGDGRRKSGRWGRRWNL